MRREDATKQAEEALKGFKNVQEIANTFINSVVTKEVKDAMTPEQLDMLDEGANAFNVKDGEPMHKKAEKLTKILRDYKL